MAIFNNSLRDVIEDSAFTDPVLHYPELHDSDESGYENPEFAADPRPVQVQITSPDADDFEITETSADEELQYVLTVMMDAGFSPDDRLWYDNGLSVSPYRLTAPRTVRFAGDEFVKYALVEDERGQGAGGSGAYPTNDGGDGSDDSDDNDGIVVF